MEYLRISEQDFIGKGNKKVVYAHPENQSLCVKFSNPDTKGSLADIKREIKYLKKHQHKLPFLAQYIRAIPTNRGTGYVYNRIINHDNSPAITLQKYIATNKEHRIDIHDKLVDIYHQLYEQNAVVCDLNINNFLLRKTLSGEYKLYLIDGFGNPEFIKLSDTFKYFQRKKLYRKFSGLCDKLQISKDFLLK